MCIGYFNYYPSDIFQGYRKKKSANIGSVTHGYLTLTEIILKELFSRQHTQRT